MSQIWRAIPRSGCMPYRSFANQEYRNALQSRLEIPALLRALAVAHGCRLLEVGCGRGVALTELARRCRPSRLVGIDIAPELIALAQARLDRCGGSAELTSERRAGLWGSRRKGLIT